MIYVIILLKKKLFHHRDTGEVLLEVLKHRERYQFSASFARKQVKESSVEEIIDYLRRQRQQLRENGGQQSDDKEQFFSGNDPESATTNSFEDAPRPERSENTFDRFTQI